MTDTVAVLDGRDKAKAMATAIGNVQRYMVYGVVTVPAQCTDTL